jgi:aminopeptidase N
MLRGKVGDTVFQRIIRTYYDQYKGSNADTRDFQAVAEKVSGQIMKPFFDQWLYRPGLPKLKAEWKFDSNKVNITIQQSGKDMFQFPLEIGLIDAAGKQIVHKISITSARASFSFPFNNKPAKVILDPNTALLFEGNITEK